MATVEENVKQVATLNVNIDKKLIDDLETMSKNSGKSVEDLVSVAIKRFRSSHADYMGINLDYP